MKNFIVYNKSGKILRSGKCQEMDFLRQAQENEFVTEGKANDIIQKIQFDTDKSKEPINPRIIDKKPDEIESIEIPEEEQTIPIKRKVLKSILDRLDRLEKKTI